MHNYKLYYCHYEDMHFFYNIKTNMIINLIIGHVYSFKHTRLYIVLLTMRRHAQIFNLHHDDAHDFKFYYSSYIHVLSHSIAKSARASTAPFIAHKAQASKGDLGVQDGLIAIGVSPPLVGN